MASPTADGPECTKCRVAEEEFFKVETGCFLFTFHLDVHVIKGKLKYSEDKRKKLKEIEKKVSALRNTTGGKILIHLEGQDPEDRYLGHLDDFIDVSLKNLIPDGQLFTEIYNRKWLCQEKQFGHIRNIVLLEVKKSDFLATVDFKTKVPSEFKIENPSTLNIVSLLLNSRLADHIPSIRGLQNFEQELHENRNIELKFFKPNKKLSSDVNLFVDYVWHDLRFKENLCSLSKLESGGSYYVGVREKPCNRTYESKEIELTGFSFTWNSKLFKVKLLQKLSSEASFQTHGGDLIAVPNTIIEVVFHNHPSKTNFCILEIAVGFANGIVFYNKKGPETYTLNEDGKVCRMEHAEWLGKMKHFSLINRMVKQTSSIL